MARSHIGILRRSIWTRLRSDTKLSSSRLKNERNTTTQKQPCSSMTSIQETTRPDTAALFKYGLQVIVRCVWANMRHLKAAVACQSSLVNYLSSHIQKLIVILRLSVMPSRLVVMQIRWRVWLGEQQLQPKGWKCRKNWLVVYIIMCLMIIFVRYLMSLTGAIKQESCRHHCQQDSIFLSYLQLWR